MTNVLPLKPSAAESAGPPADLAEPEREMWRRLQAEYGLEDAGAAVLLGLLCRNLQLSRECRERIEKDGKIVNGREHALLKVQRDADKQAAAAMRHLNLLEPLRDGPGRPPGR